MPGAAPRAFAATHLDGRAIAHRQVHHPADFAAVHLAKRSAKDGEILSVNVHCPAVDLTIARHDPFAEDNRIQVEQDKTGSDHGRYLHPNSYGQPPQMGIDYRPTDVEQGGER